MKGNFTFPDYGRNWESDVHSGADDLVFHGLLRVCLLWHNHILLRNNFIPDKITEERKRNGWSQEELASQLGVSRQAVLLFTPCPVTRFAMHRNHALHDFAPQFSGFL